MCRDENDLTERLGPKRNMKKKGKGFGQDFSLPRGWLKKTSSRKASP
jgi:hypothetical protein